MLILVLALGLCACGGNGDQGGENEEKVMTYAEFEAAAKDSKVIVETYVQAKQGWWDNKASVYTQTPDGAYFLYNMACSEADYAKLTEGTKIQVTGYKAEWSGEIEIVDATFKFVEGAEPYVAETMDATALLGTDELIKHQNKKVSFDLLTVVPSKDKDGNEKPFLYNWDGSGNAESDSDLYFKAAIGDKTYTFVIEYYLTGPSTDAYKAVQALQIGDVISLEGFLYWYEGSQPHVTNVLSVMDYEAYAEAELESKVLVETYVQAKQGWWDNKATVYTQDEEGGYFLYNMPMTKAEYDLLTVGTKLAVVGYKTVWSGEVEIIDSKFMILEADPYVAEPVDLTAALGTDELINSQNMLAAFKGLTVVVSTDKDGVEKPFLYGWDGSGDADSDSDLYFKATVGDKTYTFVIEYYLTGPDSDAYKAVQALQVGDVIDLEGFLYWYEGPQAHITKVTVK